MLKILQSWLSKQKKTIYEVGDKLYYLAPESQKVYSFIVDEIIISKYCGIRYGGEWNGILGGEYFGLTSV